MMNPDALWKVTVENRQEALLTLDTERLARKVQAENRVSVTTQLSRFWGFVLRRKINRKSVAHA